MARITIPEGDGGELVQVWSLSPELGMAVGNLSAAVYGERLVSPRVREVARMRIAQINGCNICMAWRVPALAKHGVDEALYEHVEDPANGDYSEQELLAIEYADKGNITIIRTENGQEKRFKFNYNDVLDGKNIKQNILLQPGDTVVVR